ncbi:hypothetical protein BKA82DRAFT_727106 [Pisolithus tinctorius]|uniref:Ribosomal RNA-processing protein 14 N-terminal domain-containing protein n=1 Tax=Pisolithus tinctorius Marx 270 TaxID=870435 RepID=A0A0C3NKR7_PISTI|nr:hypothetical protein BKA82DRAFT_727106 [Pisolithus tinctorius]KIO01550.1 hypothetical protein M404DRAFT_727106 [Pisolithus tinctorius Marx 270]
MKHSENKKAPKQSVKEASKKARREKLDPDNHKSIVDIQNETAVLLENSRKTDKEKHVVSTPPHSSHSDSEDGGEDEDEDERDDVMHLDGDEEESRAANEETPIEMVPMRPTESVTVLKEKLHARMAALRQGGGGEPGNKDELLEERRKQRATLREKRRKETKERKRAEKEKAKGKQKESKRMWMHKKDVDAQASSASIKNQLLVNDSGFSTGLSNSHDAPLTNIAFSAIAGFTSKKAAQLKSSNNPTHAKRSSPLYQRRNVNPRRRKNGGQKQRQDSKV